MDAGFGSAGVDDERAGAGAVLWRTGAEEKYSGHDDADLRDDGGDYGAVGAGDVLAGVWEGNAFIGGLHNMFLHGVGLAPDANMRRRSRCRHSWCIS